MLARKFEALHFAICLPVIQASHKNQSQIKSNIFQNMIIFYLNHFIVAEWTLNLIPPLDFPDKAKYYGHTANHLAVSFSHFFYNDCVNLKGFFLYFTGSYL